MALRANAGRQAAPIEVRNRRRTSVMTRPVERGLEVYTTVRRGLLHPLAAARLFRASSAPSGRRRLNADGRRIVEIGETGQREAEQAVQHRVDVARGERLAEHRGGAAPRRFLLHLAAAG